MAITWLPGVATNITPLLTIGGASWPLIWPVEKDPHRLQPVDIAARDLIERAVAPAVIGAPDHQPVAVFGVLQALGRDRLVVLQNRRNGRGRRLAVAAPMRASRAGSAKATAERASEYSSTTSHATVLLQADSKPTRAVNGPATRQSSRDELEWQCRQRPRRFAFDDLCAVRGIELRAMAGAMQDAARPRASRPPRSPYACRWRYTRQRRLRRATVSGR